MVFFAQLFQLGRPLGSHCGSTQLRSGVELPDALAGEIDSHPRHFGEHVIPVAPRARQLIGRRLCSCRRFGVGLPDGCCAAQDVGFGAPPCRRLLHRLLGCLGPARGRRRGASCSSVIATVFVSLLLHASWSGSIATIGVHVILLLRRRLGMLPAFRLDGIARGSTAACRCVSTGRILRDQKPRVRVRMSNVGAVHLSGRRRTSTSRCMSAGAASTMFASAMGSDPASAAFQQRYVCEAEAIDTCMRQRAGSVCAVGPRRALSYGAQKCWAAKPRC